VRTPRETRTARPSPGFTPQAHFHRIRSIPVAVLCGGFGKVTYERRPAFQNPLRHQIEEEGREAQVESKLDQPGTNRARKNRDNRRRASTAWLRSAAASLGGEGYKGQVLLAYRKSRRTRPPIDATGGINAAKNYQNDGDSVTACSTTHQRRRFPAPAKPKFTALAEVRRLRASIIDQCVAQGVLLPGKYGGPDGQPKASAAAVSRTNFLRPGQTGQQLSLGRINKPSCRR